MSCIINDKKIIVRLESVADNFFTKISTNEKLNEAISINTVPNSKGTYPGLIMIIIPIKPSKRAAVRWKRMTSPKTTTASTVVNSGVVKPRAVAFSKCIMPIALNQQIIEIIFIEALKICKRIFLVRRALKLFLATKGVIKMRPIRDR